MKELLPQEKTKAKNAARDRGVDIFHIFDYEIADTRNGSSTNKIICKSHLKELEIVLVLIEYFNQYNYQGKVSVRKTKANYYNIVLTNRINKKVKQTLTC